MNRPKVKHDRVFGIGRRSIIRRQFLYGAGVALGLPLLDGVHSSAQAATQKTTDSEDGPPRRMLAICNNLGLLPGNFFPDEDGKGYTLSPYLSELETFRDQMTVLSGVSHPGVDGSHSSDVSFLTAAPHPASGGFRNSISLDQYIAARIGHLTRFGSLTLGVNVRQGRRSLSWTSGGVLIPCEDSASDVYQRLFLRGSQKDVERRVHKLKIGESILDVVGEQAKTLQGRLGTRDKDRMDQYTTAVRDVERRLVQSRAWERKPKPTPSLKAPVDPEAPTDYMQKTRLMYQMAQLAFESDSTRAVTLLLDSNNSPTINVEGASILDGYHNLSHHGKNEKKLQQLEAIDRAHMQLLNDLLGGLQGINEGGDTLLDRTMVVYGSNFGDASKHITSNMPVLVAGGGFKHGQHLAFDRKRNYPLPNLFVSMLGQMGIEADRFASSTGTMRGLEPAT
ncbi:MAG: hypothetical protein COA78_35505 [Blastopirellula sp.]|nr:MAG: hypothetical protein COA78_35505 [Blastopirellula sp.]